MSSADSYRKRDRESRTSAGADVYVRADVGRVEAERHLRWDLEMAVKELRGRFLGNYDAIVAAGKLNWFLSLDRIIGGLWAFEGKEVLGSATILHSRLAGVTVAGTEVNRVFHFTGGRASREATLTRHRTQQRIVLPAVQMLPIQYHQPVRCRHGRTPSTQPKHG